MAATAIINNKFLNYKTFDAFKADLDAGFILSSSIVLIDDIQWIYSHGTYWKCSEFDASGLQNAIDVLEGKVEVIEGDDTTEGSIAHAVKTLETAINTRLTTIEGNVAANQTAIGQEVTDRQTAISGLNGNITSTAKQPFTSISESSGIVTASTGNINAEFVDITDTENLLTATNVEGAIAEIAKEVDANTTAIRNTSDSIDTKIGAAVQNLDSEITSEDGTHVNVTVTEEDGKITGVSVSEDDIASAAALGTLQTTVGGHTTDINTLKGGANTAGSVAKAVADAKSELLGDAAADYNTLGKLEDKIQEVAQSAKTYEISAVTGAELTALGTNVKEAWKLIDEDGTQAGSTIKIYKDSNLKSVSLDGQTLNFTYILSDGTESEVGVDVGKFLAESEFSDGLQVSNHVVSVALASSTNENSNYLIMEDVEGSKKLAVREIKTNDTVLQKDIKVAGLTSVLGAGNYSNNDVIPAGTDIYTILQNILCKELYPTPSNTAGSITASLGAPTVTLDTSGTVEVGTLVRMTAAAVGNSTVSTVKPQVNGLTYGWSATDDDVVENDGTSISKTWSTAVTSGSGYSMSATLTGFNADTVTNKKTVPASVNTQAMAATTLGCIAEGTNKIKVTATGASFTGSVDGINSVFIGSNLGNTDAGKKTTAIAAISNKESNTPSNSKEVSITGVYKYFLGYSANTTYDQFNSASVRALTTKTGNITKDGTTTIVNATAISSNGTSIVIACPKKYKLATINNGVGANILGNFSSSGTVSVATGSINTEYTVYVYPITNGAVVEFKNVTLTKA